MDNICGIVLLIHSTQCIDISDIDLSEVVVRSVSCCEIDLLDITRVCEHIDIDELYLRKQEDIFREKIGTDESGSSGDDDGFLHISLEEFFEYHTKSDSKRPTIALSLTESILVIVDIDWDFLEVELMYRDLIDELTRILHAIHGDLDLIQSRNSEHTIAVMRIGKMDP